MDKKERILSPAGNLRGGTYLPHHKNTSESASEVFPSPERVIIPLRQHIGAPCAPTVKKGDTVYVGTVIGDSDHPVSAPIHSSISGTVEKIEAIPMPDGSMVDAVFILSDSNMTPDPNLKPPVINSKEDFIAATRASGLVGLGGAGFPTHIKFNVKEGVKIDTLIINAAECEPFITADDRCCIEESDDILEGVYLIKELLGIEKVIIAVESNKPEAIKKLYSIATDFRDVLDDVKLMALTTKYPQGAEKVIIYSTLKRIVPMGKLPSDVGCIVMNVSSVAALYRFIKTGMPLVTRRLTVDGNAIENPKNVIVPIGTPVSEILSYCRLKDDGATRIIMGGPMMGTSIPNTDYVIGKTNNAVLAFYEDSIPPTTPCIHCGKCASGCPMKLNPASIEQTICAGAPEKLKSLYADYCMECGSCAFNCPAKRPLAQIMRIAKKEIRRLNG